MGRLFAAFLALCAAGSGYASTTINSATLDGGVYSSGSPYTVAVGQVINACLTVSYSGSGNWKSNGVGFDTSPPAWTVGTNCTNNGGTPGSAGTYTQCVSSTVQASPTGTLNAYFGTFTNTACGGTGDSLTWAGAVIVKPVSAINSTVSASPTSVAADGTTTSTITVTLKNGAGSGISGKTVTLAAGSGSSTITTLSGTTNASGVATYTVKDSTAETVTYTATDTTDSVVVTQTAAVTFTRITAPTVTKSFSPTSVAVNGTSTLTVTITNPNTATITGLAFTDSYPANLKNATTPALSNTCGGTATGAANGTSLSVSAGSLAGSSSCTVSVSVTSTTGGSYSNPTAAMSVTSNNANTGALAMNAATLTVASPASSFNIVDGNYGQSSYDGAGSHDIYTKLAGWDETAGGGAGAAGNTTFKLDVIALNSSGLTLTNYVASGNTKNVKLELFDDSSGTACNSSAAACSTCSKTVVATVNPVTFAFADSGYKNDVAVTTGNTSAYARLIARITDTTSAPTVYGCSTDAFTVRPQGFTVTAKNSGGTAMIGSGSGSGGATTMNAGGNFTLTATSGTVNYTGTPSINNAKVSDFLYPASPSAVLSGSFTAAAQATGTASGTFTYGEVGYFNLAADAVWDNTYTGSSTSNDIANNDCVNGSTSNVKAAGLYGCNVGSSVATSWGRFIPDHFVITLPTLTNRADSAACSASTFTYLGEDFKTVFTITAQNLSNATTYNYADFTGFGLGNYAKLGPNTWSNFSFSASAGTLSQGATGAPTGSWGAARSASGGQATVTAYHKLARTVVSAPLAGVTVTATPTDSDSVTGTLSLGSSNFYYGRLRLLNGYGSELLPILIPVQADYCKTFGGGVCTAWATNTLDSCTLIPTASVAIGNPTTAGLAPTDSAAATLSSGQASITLTQGATKHTGSVSVALNLGGSGGGGKDLSCISWAPQPASSTASLSWLQYAWCTGKVDPNAGAKFGSPPTPYIYRRESY